MKLLITNDDGIHAPGLWALYKHFKTTHHAVVVAPDRERSAVSHGITLHQPLRAGRVCVNGGYEGFAVNGTPADCVKLGLRELIDCKPDLVVSGINPGANVGVNINYSGTVSAAREAVLYGIPAIAVSVAGSGDGYYDAAARFTVDVAANIMNQGLPFGTLLNINWPAVPTGAIAGVKISRQGVEPFADRFEKRTDPRNLTYYWQGADPQPQFENPEIDVAALKQNYVTITPIKCDMTDYRLMQTMKTWKINPVAEPERNAES